MGGGKKAPAPPPAVSAPAPIDLTNQIPTPIGINETNRYLPTGMTQPYNLPNEYVNFNGQQAASRIYDPYTGGYTQSVNMSQGDKEGLNTATSLLPSIYQGASQALAVTPLEKQRQAEALYIPSAREYQKTYNTALGRNIDKASAMGAENSIGFDNYRAKALDAELADALSSLRMKADTEAENLASTRVAPFINVASMLNAGADNATSRALQMLVPASSGTQQSVAALAAQFADKLNAMTGAANQNNTYFTNQMNNANALNNYNLNNAQTQNSYNASTYGTYAPLSMQKRGIFG